MRVVQVVCVVGGGEDVAGVGLGGSLVQGCGKEL